MKYKILILDDDIAVCSSLVVMLKKKGFEALAIQHPSDMPAALAKFEPQLVILDLNFSIDTSGKQGLRVLEQLMSKQPSLPVILMTGWATVQLAVQGMKMGARDFLAKPWDNAQLMASIETILTFDFPKNQTPSIDTEKVVGQSQALRNAVALAEQAAATEANVLITGESGTGKEVLAEIVHQGSKRANGPFVKVNLGGISQSLFESEMFGHKKGAFTDAQSDRKGRFEMAQGGTIFLDEIGDLPLPAQVKLLRVLQEKTYEPLGSSETKKADVRVVCATNKDLSKMVADGTFREDLYYRINLIRVHLPPLRERREDIESLVNHFANCLSTAQEIQVPQVSPAAKDWLKSQEFPGNIRQLRNLVERCLLLNMGKSTLEAEDFQKHLDPSSTSVSTPKGALIPSVGSISLDELEKQMVVKALEHHAYSISEAARALGITRSSLYRRIEKFGISV